MVGLDDQPCCRFLAALRVVFPAALFADSVDLKGMAGGQVVVSFPDLLLQLADFRGEELD